MDIFRKAWIVRLRSHNDKYLAAEDDEESVHQDRRGTTKNTRWTVEMVPGSNVIRLQSCYGKYLTATGIHFLLGATGKKVVQFLPGKLDSSAEWEPICDDDGIHVRFKSRYGQFLRANKGLPPWRNSITHDIPSRTVTQDWILWTVDILQIRVTTDDDDDADSTPTFSRTQSGDSLSTVSFPLKLEGRMIYYEIGDDCGKINEEMGQKTLIFHGSELTELKKKLEEESGIEDVMICYRNPLNDKLCPLQLHLPPNNTTMHIILVPASFAAKRAQF